MKTPLGTLIAINGKQQCEGEKNKQEKLKEKKKHPQKLGILVPFSIGAFYILAASSVYFCTICNMF